MECPFPGEKEESESDQDAQARPNYWLIAAAVATAELLRRHARGARTKYDVLSEAEDVVARHAEKVPMPVPGVGVPVASNLRRALESGASGATGVAAAWAIRQVIQGGGRGAGGYHFPSVFDPRLPQMPR